MISRYVTSVCKKKIKGFAKISCNLKCLFDWSRRVSLRNRAQEFGNVFTRSKRNVVRLSTMISLIRYLADINMIKLSFQVYCMGRLLRAISLEFQ